MPVVPITHLGECRHPSPVGRHVPDDTHIPAEIHWLGGRPPGEPVLFEEAGPRARLFFDPARARAGIVTCGGLCPGFNNVIRSLVLQLYHGYGVREVLGFLHDRFIHVPIELLTSKQKQIDPAGSTWQAVLACTGQPTRFE